MQLKSKKKVLIGFVSLEISILVLVGFWVYKRFEKYRHQEVLGKITVLDKDDLLFPKVDEFKYIFTFSPNSTEEVHIDWLDYKPVYTYNADGLNERFDYQIEKKEKTFRIVTLGDSFTFGQFVDTKDNWTELLEDKLNQISSDCQGNKFEVINLGMPGYDIPYIVHRYETLGAKYRPDLIVWFETGSGFLRHNEILFPIIKACEKRLENNPEGQKPIEQVGYYQCWNEAENQIAETYTREEISAELKKYLDEFLKDKTNVRFYAFVPRKSTEYENKMFISWAQTYPNHQFMQIIPDIFALKQKLPDSHPSREGHKTISDAIFMDLQKNALSQICNQFY